MNKDEKTILRQKELYRLLERVAADSYVDQESIVVLIGAYPRRSDKQSFHDSTARRMLTQDIQEVNEDPTFPGIIISAPGLKGIKLANKSEAREYIDRLKLPCFQKLKRLSRLEEKLMLHGQMDMDGKERLYLSPEKEMRKAAVR